MDEFKPKILVLGPENRHRSPMVEAYLKTRLSRFGVVSAGLDPAPEMDPKAREVLAEDGFEVSSLKPSSLGQRIDEHVQLVVYVNRQTEEQAPIISHGGESVTLSLFDPEQSPENPEDPLQPYRRLLQTIQDEVPGAIRDELPVEDLS